MTKYVRETTAGKAISAYVILKGSREVATVLVHFGSSGRVLVNVFQGDKAAERSARYATRKHKKQPPQNVSAFTFQHATAGWYGYDKLTAALSGLVIDGHELTDHCGKALSPPKGHSVWPKGAKAPRGYSFANYHAKHITFGFDPKKHKNPNFQGEEGWSSCYREPGLKYMSAIGYRVLQAI